MRHEPHTAAAPHWSYSGATGPEHWGELCPAFALCSLGHAQSPIDLAGAQPAALAPVVYHYGESALCVRNNGHSIQVECGGTSAIELDGRRYALCQFHFHAPSEHTVAGRYDDMEAHLVHVSAQRDLAVVGVFMRRGRHHAGLAALWQLLPRHAGQGYTAEEIVVHPEVLLPASRRAYRYEGSLTTPPGTEGVHWIMLAEPIELSPAQLAAFRALYAGNNRPPQPRHDRPLWIVD
ncbi:MAG: carbonic anhydrase family protein [Chloroflexota bacterium]